MQTKSVNPPEQVNLYFIIYKNCFENAKHASFNLAKSFLKIMAITFFKMVVCFNKNVIVFKSCRFRSTKIISVLGNVNALYSKLGKMLLAG